MVTRASFNPFAPFELRHLIIYPDSYPGFPKCKECILAANLGKWFCENDLRKPDGDCGKIGGQAAIAIGRYGSLAGWNFCPKPEPSVPL
jgi:hypothetical protein